MMQNDRDKHFVENTKRRMAHTHAKDNEAKQNEVKSQEVNKEISATGETALGTPRFGTNDGDRDEPKPHSADGGLR